MSKGKEYRVVVVGCGVMGREYLGMLEALERVRVIGVVDRKAGRAREYAEEFGVNSHGTDYEEYLGRDDVDIVVVTTRPTTHARIAIDALRAGKHVLSEKPMCATLAEAQAIVDAVRETGRKMRVAFVLRSNQSCQKVAELIRGGAIGKPIVMRLLGSEHNIDDETEDWNRRLLLDTSPVIDCGSHYVDIMRWITGEEAESVSGAGVRIDPWVPEDNYNFGSLCVRFDGGSIGLYEVAWARTTREFWEKEFIGPEGRIRLVFANERAEHREEGDLIELFHRDGQYEIINVRCPWLEFDKEFLKLVALIEEDGDPVPGLIDAARSLEIVLAGHEAIMKRDVRKGFVGVVK